MKSQEIWEEIKEKEINMFALSSKVSDYCEYKPIDTIKCFLVCKATAVLPALEIALGNKYTCSLVDKYVVVEKVDALRQ